MIISFILTIFLLLFINGTNSENDSTDNIINQKLSNTNTKNDNDEHDINRMLEKETNNNHDSEADKYSYVCIVDAGSTGSRIHVYRYIPSLDTDLHGLIYVDVANEEYKKFTPGLSSFEDKPTNINEMGKYLEDILQFGRLYVPQSQRSSTPLFVLASAGMRKVRERNAKIANDIMNLCFKYLLSTEFIVIRSGIKIIEGTHEGLWGWIAANYLNGELLNLLSSSLQTETTKGVLEMGGESLQITFIPSKSSLNSLSKHTHSDSDHHIETVKIGDISFQLFTYSWMGIGMEAAQNSYDRYLITKSQRDKSPCYIKGDTRHRKHAIGQENEWEGSGSFGDCYNGLSSMIDETLKSRCTIPDEDIEYMMCSPGSVLMPKIDLSVTGVDTGEFYYIENFYYTAKVLGLTDVIGDKFISAMRQSGEDYCSLNYENAQKKYTTASVEEIKKTCFCVAWLLAILNKGFNLENFHKFSVIRDIDGKGSIDWALGYLVAEVPNMDLDNIDDDIDSINGNYADGYTSSYTFRFLLMFMVIMVMIYCWYQGIKNSSDQYNNTKSWLYTKLGINQNGKNPQIQYHYQQLNITRRTV